jgi:hypothetical protein
MIKFKPKSTTEKLFTKENVFQWIETLEEADSAIDKMVEICDEHDECIDCPFLRGHCPIDPNNKNNIKRILRMLYQTVTDLQWEDEDDL